MKIGNTDNNGQSIIQSISSEDMSNPKSNSIKYLQYLSILFSILFSIAGIYYFFTHNETELIIETNNTVIEKEILIETKQIYSGGIRMGDYIWSDEIGERVTYKEANEFCYNIAPKGLWRVPDAGNIATTHVDENGRQFENKILRGNFWYYFNLEGASDTWCYNPSINTMGNCSSSNGVHISDGKEKYIRCITEYSNIDPSYVSYFPGCEDKNIHLANGQIWSACNLGATKKWDKVSIPTSINQENWTGKYYQFSRMDPGFTSQGYKTTDTYQTYFDPISENDNWGTTNGVNDLSHKGPCPTGWHIPTIEEWRHAYMTIGNSVHDLKSALYLSETGYRNGESGEFIYSELGRNEIRQIPTYYWSSTVWDLDGDNIGYVAMIDFQSTERSDSAPTIKYKKGYNAYAIRCLKDK